MSLKMSLGEDGQLKYSLPDPSPAAADLNRVKLAAGTLDRAMEDYERGRAGLLRPDGEPRYSPVEMAEHLAQLGEPLRRAIAAADQASTVASDQAGRMAAGVVNPDPVGWLSSDELAAANSRAGFVREDVERLSLDALAQRLAGVVAGGDRPSMWLHWRYADQRLSALRRAAVDAGTGVPAGFGPAWALVERLTVALRPTSLDRRAETAEQLKRAVIDLKIHAHRAGQSLTPGADPVGDQARAFIRSVL